MAFTTKHQFLTHRLLSPVSKILALLSVAILSSCSEKPKLISTKIDFSEIYSELPVYERHLQSVIRLKKIKDQVFWSLEIVDPKDDHSTPDRTRYIQTMIFMWLKDSDHSKEPPYVLVSLKDDDGFTMESVDTSGLPTELVEGHFMEPTSHLRQLRTQGSFEDSESRFRSIAKCDAKFVLTKESKADLLEWMTGVLEEFDRTHTKNRKK